MGLSASQGRLLLLTARQNDLEFQAQQISQQRLVLAQELDAICQEYEDATSNRQMKITQYLQSETDAKATTTTNLTFAKLLSGTVGLNSDITGIRKNCFGDLDYASTTFYRLVSVDGYIVVSNANQIPTQVNTKTTSNAENVSGYNFNKTSIVKTKAVEKEGDETISSTNALYCMIDDTESTDLSKVYATNPSSLTYGTYTDSNGKTQPVISSTSGTSTLYYDPKTGAKIELPSDASFTALKYDSSTGEISSNGDSSIQFKAESEGTPYSSEVVYGDAEPNADGTYTVEVNGKEYNYIIDEALADNSSDPNYLQDCLRNGKYLLQKYNSSSDDENKKWTEISWDATNNIQDSYYTDDDAAAEAKYNRLQKQIEAQDKKLQLQLDNIETQRDAVKTEIESVNKVIDDNVKNTFNAFS